MTLALAAQQQGNARHGCYLILRDYRVPAFARFNVTALLRTYSVLATVRISCNDPVLPGVSTPSEEGCAALVKRQSCKDDHSSQGT